MIPPMYIITTSCVKQNNVNQNNIHHCTIESISIGHKCKIKLQHIRSHNSIKLYMTIKFIKTTPNIKK